LKDSSRHAFLPVDAGDALLAGRIDLGSGPTPVLVRGGRVEDVSHIAPFMADLLERDDVVTLRGEPLFELDELARRAAANDPARPFLLSPVDLQVVKAAGVTFALSAIERVIEERARGDSNAASEVRDRIESRIGGEIRAVVPGSPDAARLKQALIDDGLWSQYLEVAIGPDAEIFTKSPVLSTVGWGAEIGVRSDSTWNNPEPEIVMIVDSRGNIRGAALGNDVNLRDFEGRSALLLGKAKDNNASCAIGPFIRLFDKGFTLASVEEAEVTLEVDGPEGYRLEGASSMRQISRPPAELVRQAMSEHHYPDGFALFLGTLFAPVQDRDEPGRGFTHKVGDRVRIASPKLGILENRVTTSKAAAPWAMGIRGLIENLVGRGLIGSSTRKRNAA
jgi:fumarylacetoacetate (FAA) hydrolase family protein